MVCDNMNNLIIEMVIRKKDKSVEWEAPPEDWGLGPLTVSDLSDRTIINVQSDWSGFKDGTIQKMIDKYGESLYIALAYFSTSGDVVVDFDGNRIRSFDSTFDGKFAKKFVKKELVIVKTTNNKNKFEVKGYCLDLRMFPPIVKMLDVYSGGESSGITVDMFIKEKDCASK